jgi:arylsulfatase A-like enzyme
MKALVIIAHGLRADYIGCYGNPHVETPALDALAASGVVFDHHFAVATEPIVALLAWRTGRYYMPGSATTPGSVDSVEALNNAGVATSLVADASRPLAPGLTDGWQETELVPRDGDETPLERTIAATRNALARQKNTDRWLLCVEVSTLLPPWDLPAEFAEHYFRDEIGEDEEGEEDDEEAVKLEPLTPLPDPPLGPVDAEDDTLYLRLQGSYSAAVTYFDAGVAELMRAVGDDVFVLVTSDFGFALGEHGFVGPGLAWPAESVTQIPLILRLPGKAEAGMRIPALTQTVDLAATLAGFFALPFTTANGHDLGPLVRGESAGVRPYAVSWSQCDNKIGRALRSPEWSFVLPAGPSEEIVPRLYVRPDDHWEVNNVHQHHLDFADALTKAVGDFEAAMRQPGPIDVPPLPAEECSSMIDESNPQ